MKSSLAVKFIVPIMVIIMITTLALTMAMIGYVSQRTKEKAETEIKSAVGGIIEVLSVIDGLMSGQVKRSMSFYMRAAAAAGGPSIGGQTTVGVKSVPDVLFGDKPQAGQFEIVDAVAESMGGTATLFVKNSGGATPVSDEFVRISTNVKKEDGSRAVGTILDPNGRAIEAIRRGVAFYGQVDILGRPYITGYEPVKDASGVVIGIYYVGYRVENLEGLESAVKKAGVLDNGFIAVIDAKGVVRFHTEKVSDDAVASALKNVGAAWVVEEHVFAPWNFKIAAAYPKSDIRKHVVGASLIAAACGFAAFFLLTAFIYITLKGTIISPVNDIVVTAGAVADGNLAVKIPTTRKDEVGMLYTAFKTMTDGLRQIVFSIKASAEDIRSAGSQLSAAAEKTSAGISEQSLRAAQIATASDEMTQTVTDIAQNATKILNSTMDTAATALEGGKIVGKAVREVNAIAEIVNASAVMISSLGERSKQIGEIINVINEIAEQTNLLALNAAIEAARAGEQGRGFAVVADEVRKLAERTAKATSEISHMIGAIQDEVQRAVSSMEVGTGRVATGVEFAVKAGDALQAIVSSVQGLQEMVQQIATATEEMSQVAGEINRDIESVAEVARDTSNNSANVSAQSESLKSLSEQLYEITTRFDTGNDPGARSIVRNPTGLALT
jgi:methyl-accepting chemotaxis protein